MAQARRAGRKTETRRLMVAQPDWISPDGSVGFNRLDIGHRWSNRLCPYGVRGDLLAPTERWRAPVEFDHLQPAEVPKGTPVWLESHGVAPEGFGRARSARFMPLHLVHARDRVVDTFAQRLLDITEEQAIAEGIEPYKGPLMAGDERPTVRDGFLGLMRVIHGKGVIEANPCVWVVRFEVLEP